MLKTIRTRALDGRLTLSGQLKKGPYNVILDLDKGEYRVAMHVRGGKMCMRHSAYNCDGGTYSCPPGRGQRQFFRIKANESVYEKIIIGESFRQKDRLEIVNPRLFRPLVFEYQITPI